MEWFATAMPSARFVEGRMHGRAAAQPTYSRLEFYLDNALLVPLMSGSQPGGPLEHFDGDHLDAYWSGERSNSYSITRMGKGGLRGMLAELEQDLQGDLEYVRWRDAGATHTFYELLAGRFEPDFNYRRESRSWGGGVVRLWTQPYGHAATERVLATAVGSGALLRMPVASLAGDVDAQIDARITVGGAAVPDGRVVALSVLPVASRTVSIPPASTINRHAAATLMGASGAFGSQALGGRIDDIADPYTSAFFDAPVGPASAHLGRHRVLYLARAIGAAPFFVHGLDNQDRPLGPTAMATAIGGWSALDLGVLSVATFGAPTPVVRVWVGEPGIWGNAWPPLTRDGDQRMWKTERNRQDSTTPRFQGGHVLLLPEDSTIVVRDFENELLGYDHFEAQRDGNGPNSYIDALGHGYYSHESLGTNSLANASVTNSIGLVAYQTGLPKLAAAAPASWSHVLNVDPVDDIRVEMQWSFNTSFSGSLAIFGVAKVAPSGVVSGVDRVVGLYKLREGASGGYLALQCGPTTLASLPMPSPHAPGGANQAGYELSLTTRGKAAWVELANMGTDMTVYRSAGPTAMPVACAGIASWAEVNLSGQPAICGAATFYNCAGTQPFYIRRMRAARIPSVGVSATDGYRLQNLGAGDGVARATGTAHAIVANLAGDALGAVPLLPATAAEVAVLALPHPVGPHNNPLNVELRSRERFRFSR